jgi:hypothetical protein
MWILTCRCSTLRSKLPMNEDCLVSSLQMRDTSVECPSLAELRLYLPWWETACHKKRNALWNYMIFRILKDQAYITFEPKLLRWSLVCLLECSKVNQVYPRAS